MAALKAPRKTGKWLRDDIPHSGWQCINVTDDGGVCEMCEVTEIGHSHVMVHERLPGVDLQCGIVCAAYMTGNAEQERIRELLYKWRREFRQPIEKLRRKNWRSYHRNGRFEWTYYYPRNNGIWGDAARAFTVRVSGGGDGWCYHIGHHWWGPTWQASTERIHSEPFASDVEAALAGIERAELLLADPQWLAAECEVQAEHWVAWEAERRESDRRNEIRYLREAGCDDLCAALEAGRMTASEAFFELRRRREALKHRAQAAD